MSPFQALELIPSQSAVAMIWRKYIGTELFPAFKAAFFRPEPEPVTLYPCPNSYGCPHHVTYRDDGSIAGICHCPENLCPDVPLTKEDIIAWELSWPSLSRALAKALGLAARPVKLDLYNTWQVGSWSTDAVPVILTIQTEPHHFQSTVAGLVARLRTRFILLSPTTRLVDATSKGLLANANAALFPLETTVTLTPAGLLVPTRPPGELFAQFTPQPKATDEDAARRAFALIRQLESDPSLSPPSVLTVFRLYCIEALSTAEVARECNCSKSTILNRLAIIRSKTGVDPAKLRTLSPHIAKIQSDLSDSRARHIHCPSAIDDP